MSASSTPPTVPPVVPPITGVVGGVAGVSATYAAVGALAALFAGTADRLRDHALADARVLANSELIESALLSPVTYAEAEARVLDALSGLHGVVELAGAYEADAVLVRATLTAYQERDRLVAASFGALDYAVGDAVGCALRSAAPALALAGLVAASTWRRLPPATRRRLEGSAEGWAEEWVEQHPASVQHAVDGSGGLLEGLLVGGPVELGPSHPTVSDAASDLAALYPPEGAPQVRRRPDLATPLGTTAPPDLAGLLDHLEQTNDLSTPDRPGDQGTIEVQTLRAPDGTVGHVVYLPGTDELATLPWSHDLDVRDLPADLRLMAGDHTAYAAGIEQAMARAGIGPHDPVLLVGHSLGGMEAASLLAHGSGFDVTHVVTAGAPIGGVSHYPTGTHVLSLENNGDLVPLLDGRDNADSVQHVTVRFDDHEASVVADHGLRHYVRGAAAADSSSDPSVREQLASLRAHGFLGSSAAATSQVFQITR